MRQPAVDADMVLGLAMNSLLSTSKLADANYIQSSRRMKYKCLMLKLQNSKLVANLLGCDESYPAREWHWLLPQMEMTLNMLRPLNVRPAISAYNYVFGTHDYNRVPLALLGCKMQCFVGQDN